MAGDDLRLEDLQVLRFERLRGFCRNGKDAKVYLRRKRKPFVCFCFGLNTPLMIIHISQWCHHERHKTPSVQPSNPTSGRRQPIRSVTCVTHSCIKPYTANTSETSHHALNNMYPSTSYSHRRLRARVIDMTKVNPHLGVRVSSHLIAESP